MTTFVFGVSLVLSGNLLNSLIITSVVTACLMMLLLFRTKVLTYEECKENESSTLMAESKENVNAISGNEVHLWIFSLLKECAPLFVSTFLAFYILNAPKYSIDALMTDEIQACFGFVAMPVFVVSVLTSMIYNPVIHKMSVWWDEKQSTNFNKEVWKQFFYVVIVTLICLLGAFLDWHSSFIVAI